MKNVITPLAKSEDSLEDSGLLLKGVTESV